MRSGRLRHRITLQTRTTTRDEYGGLMDMWENVRTSVAASIEPLNGRELIAAQAVQSETTHRVTIRYVPGVAPSMRAVMDARVLDIISVLNIGERNRELQLMCSEGRRIATTEPIPEIPPNAVTHEGEVVSFNGETVTWETQ